MDNNDKFKMACRVARPCDCNAPIAYTSTNGDDTNTPANHNITLYTIDDDLNITQLFDNGTHLDCDDLNLICTKCGVSWVPFNPLF
jgi:hypothetical protein